MASLRGEPLGGQVTSTTGIRSRPAGNRARIRSSCRRPSCLMLVVLPVAASPDTIRPRRAPISRWFISTSICPAPVISAIAEVDTTTSSA